MSHEEKALYFRVLRIILTIAVFSFLCVLLLLNRHALHLYVQRIVAVLMPFIYGFVIAYLLTPVCNFFEKFLTKYSRGKLSNKWVRAISVLIAMLFAAMLVAAMLLLLLPQLEKSIVGLAVVLPGEMRNFSLTLNEFLGRYSVDEQITRSINEWVDTVLQPGVVDYVGKLFGQLTNVFVIFKNFVLGYIVAFYFLAGRRVFASQSKLLLYGVFPDRIADPIYREVKVADRIFSGFFIGKLIDSAIIAILCFIGVSIMKLESPILISTIIGVTNIIPFFGPFIGAVPCLLFLFLENPIHCIYFAVFVLILQQVDGNIIGPRVLGSSTGLPSFWILFSILVFGGLWGFVGMLVGVPLFAVIYDLCKKFLARGLEKHGHFEEMAQCEDKLF